MLIDPTYSVYFFTALKAIKITTILFKAIITIQITVKRILFQPWSYGTIDSLTVSWTLRFNRIDCYSFYMLY